MFWPTRPVHLEEFRLHHIDRAAMAFLQRAETLFEAFDQQSLENDRKGESVIELSIYGYF